MGRKTEEGLYVDLRDMRVMKSTTKLLAKKQFGISTSQSLYYLHRLTLSQEERYLDGEPIENIVNGDA